MPKNKRRPYLRLVVSGREYIVHPNEITGTETKAFRAVVGTGPGEAVARGAMDLDTIAGFLWLLERRAGKGKPSRYGEILDGLTWDAVDDLELNDGSETVDTDDPVELDDPEG